jgi:hypothetical protein
MFPSSSVARVLGGFIVHCVVSQLVVCSAYVNVPSALHLALEWESDS